MNYNRRIPTASLCVLASAIVLSGCGAPTTNSPASTTKAVTSQRTTPRPTSYEQQMQTLGKTLTVLITSVHVKESSIGGSTNENAQDIRALRRLQQGLRATADKLKQVKSPPDVSKPQQLLLKGVREYATELDSLIADLKRGDDPSGVLSSIAVLQGVQDMEKASNEITNHGYKIVTQ